MKILAIDDNELALEELVLIIKELKPSCEVHSFNEPSKLISFARENNCQIAFLDIEIWGMNGLELAVALKKINPAINIIFVTAFSKYAIDSYKLRPSGYLMKPVTKEAVEQEIENLRFPVKIKTDKRVRVFTFGNFEVFVDDKPLVFSRLKSKELFAFLVDRQGASVTTAEIAATLWEERTYNTLIKNQVQVVISDMIKVLKENKIEDIIIKTRNQISIDTAKINCDFYDLLKCETSAVNAFCGEYMVNYGWAEMTTAVLSQKMYLS